MGVEVPYPSLFSQQNPQFNGAAPERKMKKIEKIDQLHFAHCYDLSGAPELPSDTFSLGEKLVLPKGTVLLSYGEVPRSIWYLHEGIINGYRPDNNMNLAYVITKGFLAEAWYFSKRKSMDEFIAAEKCTVSKFSESAINKLIQNPDIVKNILFTLAVKSTSICTKFENFKNQTLKERLRAFLEMQFTLNRGERRLELHMCQKELARILNVHSVSISRALSDLKKEMDIQTSKNSIIITR